MKTYLIPLIISTVVLVVFFSVSESIIPNEKESAQCIIPDRDKLIEPRIGFGGPNDGKPRYSSIAQEFSIYNSDVGITRFEMIEDNSSLLLSLLPNSYGFVVMCDPLQNLQKRYHDNRINDFVILVDGKEIEYEITEKILKINVNNNTKIEFVGLSK